MPYNNKVGFKLEQHGLVCQAVSWNDLSRFENSVWGDRIVDGTFRVVLPNGVDALLPVIRVPNFTDKTGDISIDKISLLTGNHNGSDLTTVPLKDILQNLGQYLSTPAEVADMFVPKRDEHVLISPQVIVLPLQDGTVEFNPNFFSYQASSKHPSELVLMCTPEGMSVQLLDGEDNKLWHNRNGLRAPLKGERMTQVAARIKEETGMDLNQEQASAMSAVLVVQIPLKIPKNTLGGLESLVPCSFGGSDDDMLESFGAARSIGFDLAAISSGEAQGKFRELGEHATKIRRDDTMPIRVTVMRYLATDSIEVGDELSKQIAGMINKVYASAEITGSLVVEGKTGRLTETGEGYILKDNPDAAATQAKVPPKFGIA